MAAHELHVGNQALLRKTWIPKTALHGKPDSIIHAAGFNQPAVAAGISKESASRQIARDHSLIENVEVQEGSPRQARPARSPWPGAIAGGSPARGRVPSSAGPPPEGDPAQPSGGGRRTRTGSGTRRKRPCLPRPPPPGVPPDPQRSSARTPWCVSFRKTNRAMRRGSSNALRV